jgi:hypothetical protein
MRRSVFAVGTLAFAASLALAGEARAQTPVRYGVVAGLNLASMGGDIGDELDESRMGFMAGGAVEFGLSPAFSIRPEIVYTQKGAKVSEGDDEFRLKSSYIEVPVLAKYSIPMQGSVRPHLMAGPAVAFNTGCTIEIEIGGSEDSGDCEEGGLEFKSVDFGMVFGVGVDIQAFSLGIRYDLGLTDAPDDDSISGKNKVLSFVAGYTFGR